jgi:predicted MFS family arabinose efflux permease
MILLINTDEAKPFEEVQETTSISGAQVFKLLFNPTILLIGLSGGLMVGALEGFADIWAIPFFKEIYNMSDTDSNIVTSFVYIGMCFGGPALALLSDYFKSTNFMIFLTGLFTIIIFLILFFVSSLSFYSSSVLMFSLGIFCCYQVLVFSITSNIVEKTSAGLAIAIVNCINMSFGHFFHKVMSIVIEYSWDGTTSAQGIPIYKRIDYINSIAIVPICCFIGIVGFVIVARKIKVRA